MSVTERSGVSSAPPHTSRKIHELAFKANVRRTDSSCISVRCWFSNATVYAGHGKARANLRHAKAQSKPGQQPYMSQSCKLF
ncbi:hypothetical protein CY34DRAFT_809688 [Suillus luteus UH-Slu-Lm8-n1]|uniref:Uncharacterized protein n=1 Tax=Suillus luteus UH-Slu-Lm8-n1 TaxID=930992 RepID=A0A0D0A8U4_9AGAM|nr:hypothetical protein CY34DRAFT_809688 [Suillus luteus UH-Slu-Lm8-n1]